MPSVGAAAASLLARAAGFGRSPPADVRRAALLLLGHPEVGPAVASAAPGVATPRLTASGFAALGPLSAGPLSSLVAALPAATSEVRVGQPAAPVPTLLPAAPLVRLARGRPLLVGLGPATRRLLGARLPGVSLLRGRPLVGLFRGLVALLGRLLELPWRPLRSPLLARVVARAVSALAAVPEVRPLAPRGLLLREPLARALGAVRGAAARLPLSAAAGPVLRAPAGAPLCTSAGLAADWDDRLLVVESLLDALADVLVSVSVSALVASLSLAASVSVAHELSPCHGLPRAPLSVLAPGPRRQHLTRSQPNART